MLCVTMNDIPGWEIQRVCGEVFGVTVRSRNAFSQMGAGFKSLVGGELQGMTRNVLQSRNEAMTRLFAEAQARGGNALVAMRFDTTELGNNWSEICAYATAVVAVPVTEAAKQTALQLGYGQPGANAGQPSPGHPGQGHPGQGHPGQAHPGQANPGQALPGQPQPAEQQLPGQQGWQQPQQQQPGWEQPGGQQSWGQSPAGQ